VIVNKLVGDAVRGGVTTEGLKESGAEGCSGAEAVAARVCSSNNVELVDAAREVVGGSAIGPLSASRTGALDGCGCRAWRAFSI